MIRSTLRAGFNFPNWMSYHAWTLFLFTKSDIKTTLIPITCLAAASAPLASFSRLPPTVFWIWFQLLQFDVSNQTLAPEEDMYNKSYRPLPAKRISLRTALVLRWVLPLLCFAWSASYSKEVLCASIANCALTYIYDEMGFAAGHWASRNIVNAMGFASFEIGACLIAGNNMHTLDSISLLSVLCSAGIFATTIQAQDFKDIAGDALVGRRTLPLVYPSIARPTLMLALAAWSIGLSKVWGLNKESALAFNLLGVAVGGRFIAKNTMKSDQRSFYLYNVWLSLAHSLPAYFRFVAT
ncbi:UbiA prenyltransferase family [Phellopilus nigrolimitatus]|nr:UbiA prenyltransferase family [Phellopilus nigrolimitatus]